MARDNRMSFVKRDREEWYLIKRLHPARFYPEVSEVVLVYRVVSRLKMEQSQGNFIECCIVLGIEIPVKAFKSLQAFTILPFGKCIAFYYEAPEQLVGDLWDGSAVHSFML